ncbi:outer membrane protein assembly factor BamB family protein [Hyalangium gracile]|uniref:outer membrane protein assembly factor BamB family protein n=1 Tax=Hyalangium gracile TaxID=394092 RepID=UPI001CC90D7E|nr:PQQ-binding-like beta-propeller repeat protein [Hyalangium gracile]
MAGLCVISGCGVENDPETAWAGLRSEPSARVPANIVVEPGAVVFPRTTVGVPVTTSVRLRNDGESITQVLLGIPEPFTVALTSLNLPPGAEQAVDLRLEPAQPGTAGAVLLVQAEGRRIELTVRGEVDPAPTGGSEDDSSGQLATSTCSGPDGTARQAWSYVPPQDQALEFTGAVDAQGHLYATECPRFWDTAEDGPIELRTCHLLSLDRDGQVRYRRPLSGSEYVRVDLIDGEHLYGTFERTSPRVTSLAAANGSVRWSTPLFPLMDAGCRWAYVSAPVLARPNVVVAVYALGENVTCNALVALNADTGALAWKVSADSHFSQPIADSRGNLYTSHYDRARDRSKLLSYTAAGAVRWQAERTGERAPVAVNGGALTLSSEELADPDTGAFRATLAIADIPRWSPEGALPFGPSPYADVALGARGLLAVPEGRCTGATCPTAPHVSERFFYGLDATSGTLRWTVPIGGFPSAPLLTARDSLLLVDRPVPEDCEFGCQGDDSYFDSYLHEFSLDGREQVACRLQGQAPFITPPALHQGRLFLGAWLNWDISNEATRVLGLHAYDLSSPTEPAATGWVTEGGGNTRQGRPSP